MKHILRKFWHIFILLSIVLFLSANTIQAQKSGKTTGKQTDKLPTYKSLYWSDENLGVEIYLTEKITDKSNLSLLVISDKDIKVVYRTSINSSQSVVKEFTPTKTLNDKKYYNFTHVFSRTTIWMALDFTFEGKKIEPLTRTFYNSIFEIVPNNQFVKKDK
jgi:hypothetical protein